MTTIDQQIAELEKQKLQLVKDATEKKTEEWKTKIRTTIGKCYKTTSCLGYRDRVNNNYLEYIKVIGFKDAKTEPYESVQLATRNISIVCTPIGWTRKEGNKLQYVSSHNIATVTKKPDQVYGIETLESGKKYSHPFVEIYKVDPGQIAGGYSGRYDKWYEECTLQEYEEVDRKVAQLSKEFYNQMVVYVNNKYKFTEETEEMIPEIDEATIKRIDDVLQSGIDIKKLSQEISGKVAKYNYFNGTTLPELAQYSLYGDKGLLLDIQGGDDGTDYEPYTTRYNIHGVSIDWKTVLYPIRTKLDSVLDTEKDLLKLKSVSNTSSWDCEYDTSSYDATFRYAKLKPSALKDVNDTIKKHLKQ